MQNTEKVIEVINLTKNYKDFEAVKGISFEVLKGEVFGILGPNGAGKTTTLEIIEGLKKQTSGTISVLGMDNLKNDKEIKKHIGVQLQSSEYLPYLKLREQLKLFGSLYGEKVDPIAALRKVSLEDKVNNEVKELSGGQKQRFTIASALIHKPSILFLDEPTTGLDPHARREMWALVKELNQQGITVVLTTHYMEEAEYLCNKVAIMDSGKILQLDSPQGLIQSLSKVYKLSFFTDKHLEETFFESFGNLKVYNEFPKIIIELENIEVLPQIIQKLKEKGVDYKFLNLKTSTLEDVYLHLTGKSYEE
ncbi:MAG: ABC transporter ATP-binding protein [Candidatus Doudnabacteria bacterium]